jgi:hypothetical protein
MSSLKVNGLLISKNTKTGLSVNVSRCQPTKWCIAHCYRMKRTKASIQKKGWPTSSTPNTGPITWRVQRNAYVRNEKVLHELAVSGRMEETAAIVACRLGASRTVLRGNGTGDLFPELVDFYAALASKCIKVFAFSRIPEMICQLNDVCRSIGVTPDTMPYIIGSMDPSTPYKDCLALRDATKQINGQAVLAYATAACDWQGRMEVNAHPFHRDIKVVFGYHASGAKTVLGHKLECPTTAGKEITCDSCRRCFGPGR